MSAACFAVSHRMCSRWLIDRFKRSAAAAGTGCTRITDFKTRIREIVREIYLTTPQPVEAVCCHDDSCGSSYHNFISRLWLCHDHFILPTRTTATADR